MSQNQKASDKAALNAKPGSSKRGSIRLADLLPRKNVSGGGKVIFGGSFAGAAGKEAATTKPKNT